SWLNVAAKALCAAGIVPDEDGPKLDYLRTRVVEYHAEHERVIVSCSSRAMTDLVAERFTRISFPTRSTPARPLTRSVTPRWSTSRHPEPRGPWSFGGDRARRRV